MTLFSFGFSYSFLPKFEFSQFFQKTGGVTRKSGHDSSLATFLRSFMPISLLLVLPPRSSGALKNSTPCIIPLHHLDCYINGFFGKRSGRRVTVIDFQLVCATAHVVVVWSSSGDVWLFLCLFFEIL